MSLNGHPPDNLDPETNNPGNSEASPAPAANEPEPVQLAFSFALAPQEEGRKVPWAKRIQQAGYECFWSIYEDLLANPPGWETQFWLDHPNRKREWRRKALYMAWACTPSRSRKPRTQKEFAEALGITPQAIWLWKSDSPEIVEFIQAHELTPLEANLRDVDHVTIEQAVALDSSVQARKLFYERLAEARAARQPAVPAQQVNQLLQVIFNNLNWDALPQDVVERLAAGKEDPVAVLASGVLGGGQAGTAA